MSDQPVLEALRGSRLATELSDDHLRVLAHSVVLRDLQPGEVLLPEGTSDNHLYVIVNGSLGVIKNAGEADAVTPSSLTNGDLVGELGFIDGTRHYASLVASVPTRVFGIEREKLEALLPTHPDIVYRVMRAIIRAVHEIQRRISMQSTELANYIYKQHGRY